MRTNQNSTWDDCLRFGVVAPDGTPTTMRAWAPDHAPAWSTRAAVQEPDGTWSGGDRYGMGSRAEVAASSETRRERASSRLVRYTWEAYFPRDYPRGRTAAEVGPGVNVGGPLWQVVGQWHQPDNAASWGKSPPVAIVVTGNDDLALDVHGPGVGPADASVRLNGSPFVLGPLVRGKWLKFDLRLRGVAHPALGSISVSLDNSPVVFPGGTQSLATPTLFPTPDGSPPHNYFKLGLYRSHVYSLPSAAEAGRTPPPSEEDWVVHYRNVLRRERLI